MTAPVPCIDLSPEAMAAIRTCPKCKVAWLAHPLGECGCIRPGVPPEAAESALEAKKAGRS